MSAILFGVFFVLLALSFPVAHALLIGATLGVLSSDHLSLFGIIQQLFLPTQSFPLIAIPFFIMAAELMMSGQLGAASHRLRHGSGRPLSRRTCAGQRAGLDAVRRSFRLGGGRRDGSGQAADSLADQELAIRGPSAAPPSPPPPPSTSSFRRRSRSFSIRWSRTPRSARCSSPASSLGCCWRSGFPPSATSARGLRGFPYERAPVAWGQMARRGLYAMPALLMPVLVLIALRFGVLTPTEISTSAVVYAMLCRPSSIAT